MPEKSKTYSSLSTPPDVYKRLYRAKAFIDDSFDKPIDLNQIARQAYFSPMRSDNNFSITKGGQNEIN